MRSSQLLGIAGDPNLNYCSTLSAAMDVSAMEVGFSEPARGA